MDKKALLAGIIILMFGCIEPAMISVPRAFVRTLKETTTPEELRKWLSDTASEIGPITNRVEVPKKLWPKWIGTLNTNEPPVMVAVDNRNGLSAQIQWNYARAIHGLYIHSSSDFPSFLRNGYHVETFTPGIHAYHATSD